MRLLFVAPLLLLGLGGCSSSSAGATFDDLVRQADAAAESWRPGAEFLWAEAFEWRCDTAERRTLIESEILGGCDDRLGDGRANAWAFSYQTAGDPVERWSFTFGAGGRLLEKGEETEGRVTMEGIPLREDPLTQIDPLDSDRVAALLKHNQTWRNALDGAQLIGWKVNIDQKPLWEVFLSDGNGTSVEVDLDAETGDLVELTIEEPRPVPVYVERNSVDANLEAFQSESTRTFTIEDPRHLRLWLEFSASALPLSEAVAEVRSPHGNVTTLQVQTSGPTQADVTGADVPLPEAGDWTVTFRLDSPGPARMVLEWCADGDRGEPCS